MKKLVIFLVTIIVAVLIYFAGCAAINDLYKIEPDYIGKLSSQPEFTNTVRSW